MAAKPIKNQNVSKNGGYRPGAGRKKGSVNKATASIREIARKYTDEAVHALVSVMLDEEQPAAARVGAANSLLDRGYGKSATVLQGDEDGGAVQVNIIRLADANS